MTVNAPLFSWRNFILEILGTMMLVFYGGMAGAVTSYEWVDDVTQEKKNVYPSGPVNQSEI